MQATAQPQSKRLFSKADGLISFVLHNVSGQSLYIDTMEIPTGQFDEAIVLAPNEKLNKEQWNDDLWVACDPNFKSQPFRYIRSYLSGGLSK